MILLIDNYDSFVFNLARYVRELGEETVVRRHDATSHEEIERLRPSHIIISPGPCAPGDAGISTDVVRRFGPTIPILGVCLGHQCIGAAYGAGIVRAGRPVHGKAARIQHDGRGLRAPQRQATLQLDRRRRVHVDPRDRIRGEVRGEIPEHGTELLVCPLGAERAHLPKRARPSPPILAHRHHDVRGVTLRAEPDGLLLARPVRQLRGRVRGAQPSRDHYHRAAH